ncbi:hypothetical protein ILUMI_02923 [Ignelater luminosus]|uniref:Helitron helicase-like domain-containing protein n=1 Tax=Ignelater luminosus TaxID=2038154 RepID=A0A8K0DBX7_IGNLU|nr:hypothetical protein ILUMI_02923 [Ignelater luminosus]
MPSVRRTNIGRRTRNAREIQYYRANETEEERRQRLETNRLRISQMRSTRTDPEESIPSTSGQRRQNRRSNVSYERLAFTYDPTIDYARDQSVDFGPMDKICQYCSAIRFRLEPIGLCCANGKIKLPQLITPPEPLNSLLSRQDPISKHFLQNIQMGFNPTFKIQGQIHHRAGALLLSLDGEYKFLQIYFLGNSEVELKQRCAINRAAKRKIIMQLQQLLHTHNQFVQLFKTADRADKRPAGEHERRFNAPMLNEVAIVVVGENMDSRDIVIQRRDGGNLQRISETHRSYDALQYLLIFCRGEDGYHFFNNMINPATGQETNKKVSSMNFYAYCCMIRQSEDNHILKCRRLFHQFAVDMYVKIETERLRYIRLNQRRLRSEEYIHLRDAMNSDSNGNNVGRLTILPATYVGSPRHMHEYAQDAMTYVRQYGTPDLFITFTCNPKWIEITNLLLPGQSSSDRHDITARVFKQKLKALMDFIVKYHIFGVVRCWMYSVEWQKRGLPHAHILLWMVEKIRPDEIDSIICAEIPDPEVDPQLYEVVKKNMIHGPCGEHNPESPCMIDNKCSKRYPRALLADTITGNDGYPQYRRRSIEDNGRTITLQVKNNDVVVNNSWIIPYSPLNF